MPDISLLPAIAGFFGVSIDELFDYNVLENERKVDEICRAAYQSEDPARGEVLLREGLKQFPGNEILLTVLLYTLLRLPDREKDTVEVCQALIKQTANDGVRYDALRILAETYHAMGQQALAEQTLEQIPEFYFSRTGCAARLLEGKKRLEAARFQMNLSAQETVEMLRILADGLEQAGDAEGGAGCRRMAEGILEVFLREGGRELQVPGYEWLPEQTP